MLGIESPTTDSPASLLEALAEAHNSEMHVLNGNIGKVREPPVLYDDVARTVTTVHAQPLTDPGYEERMNQALGQAEANLSSQNALRDYSLRSMRQG